MKRLLCLLVVLSLLLSLSTVVFADYSTVEDELQVSILADSELSRAEETEWVYRWYDGMIQRRLWSLTYGYWLTDWETIGYYDP